MNNNFSKIAILDFDETLIKGQSQRLLIKFFFQKKFMSLYKYIVLLSWFILFKLNIFESIKPIVEFATSCISNKKVSELEPFFDEFFDKICIPQIYKNSKELIDYLKDKGFYTIMVSTAVDPIIIRAQKYFGIDEIISTRLEIINDIYTGKIIGEPMFGKNKSIALEKYVKLTNINPENMCAFADHITDIPLFSIVGTPVAVNPSQKLWKYSKEHNWPVLYLNDNESFQYFKSHIVL